MTRTHLLRRSPPLPPLPSLVSLLPPLLRDTLRLRSEGTGVDDDKVWSVLIVTNALIVHVCKVHTASVYSFRRHCLSSGVSGSRASGENCRSSNTSYTQALIPTVCSHFQPDLSFQLRSYMRAHITPILLSPLVVTIAVARG